MTNTAAVTPSPLPTGYDKLRLLGALPPRVKDAALDRAITRKLSRGTPVFWQGERLRMLPVVLEGHGKLMRNTPGGREVVVDFVGPGGAPCWPEILGDAPLPVSFIAVEKCVVAFLPIAPIRHCISTDIRSALAYADLVSSDHRNLLQQLTETRAPSVPARLAGLLLFLLDRRGVPAEGWIPIRLSRQDLADAAGTTVETAIRLMRKWEKAELVETHREGVLIKDVNRFRDVADGSDS